MLQKQLSMTGTLIRLLLIVAAASGPGLYGMTFTVTNTLDSGSGSLRQAILDANANPGLDSIAFQIPGPGAQMIVPLSALPAITDPVSIDGSTQPGFAGTPLIEIRGSSAGANAGLRLLAGGTTVRSLAINGFGAQGILVQGTGTNLIAGNYIGVDTSGTLARGNALQGIWINGSAGNSVGGTNAADRNVISANGDAGVYIQSASGNILLRNLIGTTASGGAALGNTNNGITLVSAPGNIIGGTTAASRNIISGNGGSGIYLSGAATTGNTIQGNYIGPAASGAIALTNAGDGVTLQGASGNLVGGTVSGAGNLISGNKEGGISLASATNNLIQGNLIGTDSSGASALPNQFAGVTLSASSSNSIGGSIAGAGNVISGNKKDGIFLTANSSQNTIGGNFIGLNAAGTGVLGNTYNGVTINGSTQNLIGGSSGRNVISGNLSYGVQILAAASGNQVQANYIGTDSSGLNPVANGFSGIEIESPLNIIGGPVAGAGNLISGNTQDGIYFLGASATSNLVQGNLIGTSATGSAPLPNSRGGVGFSDAPFNTVGGAAPGARNIISANANAGIYLVSSGTVGNQIQGNFIGSDITGNLALGNGLWGVFVTNAPNNFIGGSAGGAGNLISGNDDGIFLTGTGSTGNLVQGNIIGENVGGTSAIGNTRLGVYLENASSNIIGGTLTGARNVVGGNGEWAILFTNSSWNTVQGNYIGTAADGSSPLGNGNTFNGFHEIEIQAGSHDNVIGGNQAEAANRIAFAPIRNGIDYAGVRIRDGSTNNLISRNSIFSNGGLGIDLGGYLVSSNDNCDGDTGANQLQNFPQLTGAASGTGIGVKGIFNSKANSTFNLQFFASPACDSLGNGEGQAFLGEKMVSTDASCNASFLAVFPGSLPPGYVITATATDGANNTSEFSSCVAFTASPSLAITANPSTPQISLAWSTNSSGFVLKQTPSLSPPIQWTTVTNLSAVNNNQFVVSIPVTSTNSFFALLFE